MVIESFSVITDTLWSFVPFTCQKCGQRSNPMPDNSQTDCEY